MAVKNIQRMKATVPLVIECDWGVTKDTERQMEIILKFFETMFRAEGAEDIEDFQKEFSQKEIRNAVKGLKDNKSPGVDNITTEHTKKWPKCSVPENSRIAQSHSNYRRPYKGVEHGNICPTPETRKAKRTTIKSTPSYTALNATEDLSHLPY